jgi:hypothetical protein
MGQYVGVFIGNYEYILETTIDCSSFNNTFILLNIAVLISSVINGLLFSRTKIGILSTLLYIWKNKKDYLLYIQNNKKDICILLLIMLLAIWLVIYVINTTLFMLGLGIVVDTTSTEMFFYTFLAKVTSIRAVLTIIIWSIKKEFSVEHISLSIISLLVMITLGWVNYLYIIPYIYPLVLTNLATLYSLYTNILIANNLPSLGEISNIVGNGLYDILKKFPVFGRYIDGFFSKLKSTNSGYVDSPFRNHITPLVKKVIVIYPFNIISKFTSINLPRILENHVEVSYEIKTHVNNFKVFLVNNSQIIKDYVSSSVFKYSNLNLSLKVGLEDQTTNIKASFKNGCLESYTVENTRVKDSSSYSKSTDEHNFDKSILPFSSYPLSYPWDLNLSPPAVDMNSNLTVFMNNSNSSDYHLTNPGESSRENFEGNSTTKRVRSEVEDLEIAQRVDKGKKRVIEYPEFTDIPEDTTTRSKIELTEHKWIHVTEEDFDGKTWDLNSIYEKINNIMEHPEYNRNCKAKWLFKSDELGNKFHNYIKGSLFKEVIHFNEMNLSTLKTNIDYKFKQNSPYTIRKEDFRIDNLGYPSLYNKIIQFMCLEDGYTKSWTINKLIFEPFSLKHEFLDAVKNLGIYKVPTKLKIDFLRDKLKSYYNIGSSANTFNTEYQSESELNININPNMITRDDVIGGGDFNAYSIYEKLNNITENQDFDKNSKVKTLVYEDKLLKKEFYIYIKSRGILKSRDIGSVKILSLKNELGKLLD